MEIQQQDPDSEEITPFRDVNTMSYAELVQAYHEVCEDRKDFQKFIKRTQNNKWTKEDEEKYERMNQWAMIVFTALKH